MAVVGPSRRLAAGHAGRPGRRLGRGPATRGVARDRFAGPDPGGGGHRLVARRWWTRHGARAARHAGHCAGADPGPAGRAATGRTARGHGAGRARPAGQQWSATLDRRPGAGPAGLPCLGDRCLAGGSTGCPARQHAVACLAGLGPAAGPARRQSRGAGVRPGPGDCHVHPAWTGTSRPGCRRSTAPVRRNQAGRAHRHRSGRTATTRSHPGSTPVPGQRPQRPGLSPPGRLQPAAARRQQWAAALAAGPGRGRIARPGTTAGRADQRSGQHRRFRRQRDLPGKRRLGRPDVPISALRSARTASPSTVHRAASRKRSAPSPLPRAANCRRRSPTGRGPRSRIHAGPRCPPSRRRAPSSPACTNAAPTI